MNVTVTNPYSSGVSATAEVTLNAVAFGGINLEGPWPVGTVDQVISVPANGATTQTFDFSPGEYQTNGDFVALAPVNLGPSTVSGYNYTTVTSGLSLSSPLRKRQVNREFNMTVQVTNGLSTSVGNSVVSVFLPGGLTATAPTDFTIPILLRERLTPS